MHTGRTLSYGMDFKKGQVAAARLFSIIERKPDIDAQEETGDKPVSHMISVFGSHAVKIFSQR